MTTFTERFDAVCANKGSLVCVGLDPDPDLMPVKDVFDFNRRIVDATHDLVCAYKPNMAFYEALGLPGLRALGQTIDHIRNIGSQVLVVLDAKRGDIGNTSTAYAKAMFEVWEADATTVNVYGGRDSVQPFLDYESKGVFLWCRSSNPGATEFQNLLLASQFDEAAGFFYEHVAIAATRWNGARNVGLVVGGTYPADLARVRGVCPDLPIMIPGVGAQKALLEESVLSGMDSSGGGILINSSRAILYASSESNFEDAARGATIRLRDEINSILKSAGL
jgi:orotidine-5'-phosphate decarboxylase